LFRRATGSSGGLEVEERASIEALSLVGGERRAAWGRRSSGSGL